MCTYHYTVLVPLVTVPATLDADAVFHHRIALTSHHVVEVVNTSGA